MQGRKFKSSNIQGLAGLIETLSANPLSSIKSALIEAWDIRTKSLKDVDVYREYKQNPDFFGNSSLTMREIHEFEKNFLEVLPSGYQDISCSPINPLGLNAIIGNMSQNNILSTIRGSEVVADPTTILALEAARRREQDYLAGNQDNVVRVATMHRVLRLQPFDKSKGYLQHFNLAGMCSAGREQQIPGFGINEMTEHIDSWLRLFGHLNENGHSISDISVHLSDTVSLKEIFANAGIPLDFVFRNSLNEELDLFDQYDVAWPKQVSSIEEVDNAGYIISRMNYLRHAENHVLKPLKQKFPGVDFCFDFNRKAGVNYYQDLCFHIYGRTPGGATLQLADGGTVDWVARFLQNNKEKSICSGVGAELLQTQFYAGVKDNAE